MSEEGPSWLKAMENGGIGEARARALLMERFWVLERSVDVDGADYLIQQRLMGKNFLDQEPPRLAVIQVKFIQDGNTYIKVKREYAVDDKGNPYGEFFVLVFTGREDSERSFLLTSRDLISAATEIDDDGQKILRLRGSKLLETSNYDIVQKKLALDKIEHALKNASFFDNRRFIGRTHYVEINADQIDHDYTLPLDNWWGDIKKEFYLGKEALRRNMFDLDDVSDALRRIVTTTDPIEALEIYEEEISPYLSYGGRGDQLQMTISFYDDDFFEVVKNHRERLSKLRELGLEGSFFGLIATFNDAVANEVVKLAVDPNLRAIRIKVKYDEDSLSNVTVVVAPAPEPDDRYEVVESSKGQQELVFRVPGEIHEVEERNKDSFLKERSWIFQKPFQKALEETYLGADLANL